jgi:uncharacterized protein (DUF427 family)
MSTQLRRTLMSGLDGLRHEPTSKRIRASWGDRTIVDTTRAVLLWEPRRVVSSWAVPAEDVAAELVPAGRPVSSDGQGLAMPDVSRRPVLDPSILDGYVVLDFSAFDTWWEEDEVNVGHPREPFHRIDVLRSSRRVRIELEGEVLAESTSPRLLFETMLPTRCYLPRQDVVAELVPSPTGTTCAYKGHASYWSPVVGGQERPDLAWSYPNPLREAGEVAGMVCFFDERVDVVVDGVRRDRPVTPWSAPAER